MCSTSETQFYCKSRGLLYSLTKMIKATSHQWRAFEGKTTVHNSHFYYSFKVATWKALFKQIAATKCPPQGFSLCLLHFESHLAKEICKLHLAQSDSTNSRKKSKSNNQQRILRYIQQYEIKEGGQKWKRCKRHSQMSHKVIKIPLVTSVLGYYLWFWVPVGHAVFLEPFGIVPMRTTLQLHAHFSNVELSNVRI